MQEREGLESVPGVPPELWAEVEWKQKVVALMAFGPASARGQKDCLTEQRGRLGLRMLGRTKARME